MNKTLIIFITFCSLFTIQSQAQLKWSFTAGPQLLANSRRFNYNPQLGIGGNISTEYKLWNAFSLGSIIGYNQFEFERYGLNYSSFAFFLKCDPGQKAIKPVFEFDIGWYIEDCFDIIAASSYFVVAPAFGVAYKLNSNTELTVNLKINYLQIDVSDLKFYGLNFGVIF